MPLGTGDVVYPFNPYCGRPPDAANIWGHWNLDPLLIAALLAVGAAAFFLPPEPSSPSEARGRWTARRSILIVGWVLTAVALISPLCALSVSLFSARLFQHMLLAFVAAPVVALGLPRPPRGLAKAQFPAALCFAAVLWLWHMPGPYAATFNGAFVYWLMHLTMFSAALWFWSSILRSPPERLVAGAAASLFTSLQMAFLGAIITFAGRPLYAPHEFTTFAWGLTPLQDQQLGGAIMWVPAGVVFVAAILFPLAALMRPLIDVPRADTRA